MSSGTPKRTRSDRVASLKLPPGTFDQALNTLRRGDVLLRCFICLMAAIAIWAITTSWRPPFSYRVKQIPSRAIVARVDFEIPAPKQTEQNREIARRNVLCLYEHDSEPILQLVEALKSRCFKIIRAETYNDTIQPLWQEFTPTAKDDTRSAKTLAVERKRKFDAFREALADDNDLETLEAALHLALSEYERQGLLEDMTHDVGQGSQFEIEVFDKGNLDFRRPVAVRDVRIAEIAETLLDRFNREVKPNIVAQTTFAWLYPQLTPTLTYDEESTRAKARNIADSVPDVMTKYAAGDLLAKGGLPLTPTELELLQAEYEKIIEHDTWPRSVARTAATFGMYIALYLLCGFYSYFRMRYLLQNVPNLIKLLGLIVVIVGICRLTHGQGWTAETIPLLLFSMIVVIAYDQELALLLSTTVALVVVVSLGQDLVEFVVILASMATTTLMLRQLRSRTKLIYVGLVAGVVTTLTALGVGTLGGQELGQNLLVSSAWSGLSVLLASLVMTGLLPFAEHLFDVQTDLSLLELGDVAHPLLQELVRRSPGTYNHSINVASMAEAAADAIGANGLLVRVGAYFHDIGKMLKPQYFIENQGLGNNRHESLLPAMSTLIIIAHVKDGADLARQHHLPKAMIDFIQQHHGTTLVEFFYNRANEQCESDPDVNSVDEGSFRYPGPKPQSKEASVLMLADAVESAGRTLVDPTPSRIENLVEELAMHRLLDGQFDESGLTLQELRTIQDSLVKSMTAVYHSRVKYSEQTA